MIRRLILSLFLFSTALLAAAQDAPKLRHVFDIHADCAEAIVPGDVPTGKRVIIPITGGWVKGEGINGTVIPGGADCQTIDTVSGRGVLEARYAMKTDDGAVIRIYNRGVTTPEGYFITSPIFEAPRNSAYDWLNGRIFVCRPVSFDNGVTLRIWAAE